jgi:hypothetical protein
MTHRCLIERDAARLQSPDPYGNSGLPDWETHLENVPCRWWFEGVRTQVEGAKELEISTRKLVVPLETDVTEDDRIAWVHDQRGRELADGPMKIDSVGHRADHLVLKMVEVQ